MMVFSFHSQLSSEKIREEHLSVRLGTISPLIFVDPSFHALFLPCNKGCRCFRVFQGKVQKLEERAFFPSSCLGKTSRILIIFLVILL